MKTGSERFAGPSVPPFRVPRGCPAGSGRYEGGCLIAQIGRRVALSAKRRCVLSFFRMGDLADAEPALAIAISRGRV